jgi:hypothetical protein
MSRGLDQSPIHLRDNEFSVPLKFSPGGLEDTQILVHGTETVVSACLSGGVYTLFQVAYRRGQYKELSSFETTRSRSISVPMQSADALKQHIQRTEVGQENIRVEIKALLNSLCGHANRRPTLLALSEVLLDGLVESLTVGSGEA